MQKDKIRNKLLYKEKKQHWKYSLHHVAVIFPDFLSYLFSDQLIQFRVLNLSLWDQFRHLLSILALLCRRFLVFMLSFCCLVVWGLLCFAIFSAASCRDFVMVRCLLILIFKWKKSVGQFKIEIVFFLSIGACSRYCSFGCFWSTFFLWALYQFSSWLRRRCYFQLSAGYTDAKCMHLECIPLDSQLAGELQSLWHRLLVHSLAVYQDSYLPPRGNAGN